MAIDSELRTKIIKRAAELADEADRLGAIADREHEAGQDAVADGFARQAEERYAIVTELMRILN